MRDGSNTAFAHINQSLDSSIVDVLSFLYRPLIPSSLSLVFALIGGCAEERPPASDPLSVLPASSSEKIVDMGVFEPQSEPLGGGEEDVERSVDGGSSEESSPQDDPIEEITLWPSIPNLGLLNPQEDTAPPIPEGRDLCHVPTLNFPETHPHISMGREGFDATEKSDELSDDHEASVQVESPAYHLPPAPIAHPDPRRPLIEESEWGEWSAPRERMKDDEITLPGHLDDMPLYERATAWDEPRCYQIAEDDGRLFSEEEAFQLYVRLVQTTLWRAVDETPLHRTIIGVRGAYPGTFQWHFNTPNLFNDTLVLLWRDEAGRPHVREFPVNTDTGAHDFGDESSSSLRPNRHYPYINGWHRDYNAIQIDLDRYPVRDDTNNNGHWDSDRNGWLTGLEGGQDYDRLGYAHNIHGSEVDGALPDALVQNYSAGCQVIPGSANWLSFITQTWTNLGDAVDYYLIDARDISPRFFTPCMTEDGSHACPHSVTQFPYLHQDTTALSEASIYDRYNCSDADESGAERVYVLNLPQRGALRLEVTADEGVDPDLHLLDGDDAYACRDRAHELIETDLPAGRYVVTVDTWVNASGSALAGAYELRIDWAPE
jgi:hypothetical protein